MMLTAGVHLYTAIDFEEFIALPENRDRLVELIHGEMVEKVPTEEHGIIAAAIARFIGNFIEPLEIGYVGVEIRHHKPSDQYNVRMPDVSFRKGDTPIVKKGAVPQMPDLAVEIQSPDDKPRELREKADYYLRNGSRLVWLIYPADYAVEVCTLNADGDMQVKTVGVEGILEGGDVLPDFQLPVEKIFPK